MHAAKDFCHNYASEVSCFVLADMRVRLNAFFHIAGNLIRVKHLAASRFFKGFNTTQFWFGERPLTQYIFGFARVPQKFRANQAVPKRYCFIKSWVCWIKVGVPYHLINKIS